MASSNPRLVPGVNYRSQAAQVIGRQRFLHLKNEKVVCATDSRAARLLSNLRVGASRYECNYRYRIGHRDRPRALTGSKLNDVSSSAGPRVGVAMLSLETAPDDNLASAIRAMSLDVIQVSSLIKLRRLLISARVGLVIIIASADPVSGLQLCEQVRSTSDIPMIIILPGHQQEMIEMAFAIGVDECFSATIPLSECQARVRALLRRSAHGLSHRIDWKVLRFGGFVIYPQERVLRDSNGTIIDLTSTEFELVLTFCRNPGRVMTREELLSLTHTGLAGPVTRTIDVHVSRLRQKIEPDSDSPTLLKTVRLGGYIFVADVTSD